MTANEELMTTIKAQWGAKIVAACQISSVPPAFVAALIANESGGNPNAKRFEPAVLTALWEVFQGRKAAFGSIGRADLLAYISGNLGGTPQPASDQTATALQRLDGLATSWGLTQIMGYNVMHSITAEALADPDTSLQFTLKLLADFAQRFQLDVTKEFSELFACWNCGQPNPAKTSDPNYCANGVARLEIYEALP